MHTNFFDVCRLFFLFASSSNSILHCIIPSSRSFSRVISNVFCAFLSFATLLSVYLLLWRASPKDYLYPNTVSLVQAGSKLADLEQKEKNTTFKREAKSRSKESDIGLCMEIA